MKRILLSIVLLLGTLSYTNAQVILLDSDEGRRQALAEGEVPFIPLQGVTYDQYAPLSDGTMLVCCLGVAYLLKKKRKNRL